MVNLAGRKWRSYFRSIYAPYEYNYLEALQTPGLNAFEKKMSNEHEQAMLFAVAWVTEIRPLPASFCYKWRNIH